jgi:hypothetical protein
LEWGESVDENLVRLSENFCGATPPLIPVAGQLWLRQKLYVKNGASHFRWNIAAGTWAAITVTTTAGTIGAYGAGTTIGEYVYSTADAKLYRWDTAYKQASAAWMERAFTAQATNPVPPQVPDQDLLFWDEYSDAWIPPRSVAVGGDINSVTGAYDGQLYYDTDSGILYIWNAEENGGLGAWQQILGPANTDVPQDITTSSNIDMANYSIFNVFEVSGLNTPTDTDLDFAANVAYVQAYVAQELLGLSGTYVPTVGPGTMTGTYTLTNAQLNLSNGGINLAGTGSVVLSGTGNVQVANGGMTLSGAGGLAVLGTGNITVASGSLTLSGVGGISVGSGGITLGAAGQINMGSSKIVNLALPTLGTDAVNVNYLNTAVSSAITANNANVAVINPGSPKTGDILVSGGFIYIYSGVTPIQIFPARYS